MAARALLIALLLVLAAQRAEAQACPAMEGASAALVERTPAERAAFLLHHTRRAEEQARTWALTFALSYLGLAVAQVAVLAASSDPGLRTDLGVGAVGSMIGVAAIVALPPTVLLDPEAVEELAPRAAAGDCDALARAEALLVRDAASDAFGTSWVVHLGNVLFNLGIGLLLGLAYGRWVSGAISAGIGILVGEVQTLTRPASLVDALARYRAGELEGAPRGPRLRVAPAWDGTFAGVAIGGEL
jgi:hypothetical protein